MITPEPPYADFLAMTRHHRDRLVRHMTQDWTDDAAEFIADALTFLVTDYPSPQWHAEAAARGFHEALTLRGHPLADRYRPSRRTLADVPSLRTEAAPR